MNTQTILNVKTNKQLKSEAKKVAEELGVPLSTVVNAFLKQFVRDKEVTFSASEYHPTPYLQNVIREAQAEYEAGDAIGPLTGKEFIKHLKSL